MKACYFPAIARGTAGALSTLAAGEWGIVPANSSMVTTDNFITDLTGFIPADEATEANMNKKLKIVSRRSASDVTLYCSPSFALSDVVKYSFVAYGAGTKQVTTITSVLPAVQKTGDIYTIKIIDLSSGTFPMLKKSYQVVHIGTDFTTTTVLDGMRTLINADTDFNIVATGTTTLILTAATVDQTFATATSDAASIFTTVLTTKNIPSTGTLAKVQALEQECNSYQFGVYNKVLFAKTAPTKVQPTETTFDYYILELKNLYNPVDGGKYVGNMPLKLYIIEKSGATNSFGDLLKATFTANF